MVTRINSGKARHTSATWLLIAFILTLSMALLASCATKPNINPEGPYWKDNDTKGIPEPDFEEPDLTWNSIDRSIFVQGIELLDMDRNIRKISGNPTQAKNANAFDEVPNCSWFTNRHGLPRTRMSSEQIAAGPQITNGPDTGGVWILSRPKVGGATIGFWIEDSNGDQYIIKPDPKGSPELATGAAAIGAKLFHACGYNVPQDRIVYFHPDKLVIKEGVEFEDPSGKKRTFTREDLDDILARVETGPDGRIRALASLNVGNVKGPFMYMGTRDDDPNDWCPHEHRRELRGLYVIGSLVNHYDLKAHNSMNVYVGEDGSGYLKHYLMDFGSILGSKGRIPKGPRVGYTNTIDIRDIGVSMITFGLKTWPYEYAKPFKYPSIGYFESELFEANQFDVIFPNPAFEQMTDQDAYWGAKIVMAFSEEDMKALVKEGRYSDPEAEAYLLKTLLERQEKIGRHWFGKVNPLDFPTIENEATVLALAFMDLAVEYGLEPATATYQYEILYRGKPVVGPIEIDRTLVPLSGTEMEQLLATMKTTGSSEKVEDGAVEIRVRTKRESGSYSKPTVFWLTPDWDLENFAVAGIEH